MLSMETFTQLLIKDLDDQISTLEWQKQQKKVPCCGEDIFPHRSCVHSWMGIIFLSGIGIIMSTGALLTFRNGPNGDKWEKACTSLIALTSVCYLISLSYPLLARIQLISFCRFKRETAQIDRQIHSMNCQKNELISVKNTDKAQANLIAYLEISNRIPEIYSRLKNQLSLSQKYLLCSKDRSKLQMSDSDKFWMDFLDKPHAPFEFLIDQLKKQHQWDSTLQSILLKKISNKKWLNIVNGIPSHKPKVKLYRIIVGNTVYRLTEKQIQKSDYFVSRLKYNPKPEMIVQDFQENPAFGSFINYLRTNLIDQEAPKNQLFELARFYGVKNLVIDLLKLELGKGDAKDDVIYLKEINALSSMAAKKALKQLIIDADTQKLKIYLDLIKELKFRHLLDTCDTNLISNELLTCDEMIDFSFSYSLPMLKMKLFSTLKKNIKQNLAQHGDDSRLFGFWLTILPKYVATNALEILGWAKKHRVESLQIAAAKFISV